MINELVTDLLDETGRRIDASGARSVDDVRAAPPLVAFSASIRRQSSQLKRFLYRALYRHERVMRVMDEAKQVVQDLFDAYLDEPANLPVEHAERVAAGGARAIADYIAGMTDRFALQEHARLKRARG